MKIFEVICSVLGFLVILGFFVCLLAVVSLIIWFQCRELEEKVVSRKIPDPGPDHFLIINDHDKSVCFPKRDNDQAWNGSGWITIPGQSFAPYTIYRRFKL